MLRRYEVVKKKTKFDDAMAEMEERICRQFCHHGRSQCGIVYCLSRNDCEKVAAVLQQRLAARLGHRTRVRCPDLPPLTSIATQAPLPHMPLTFCDAARTGPLRDALCSVSTQNMLSLVC